MYSNVPSALLAKREKNRSHVSQLIPGMFACGMFRTFTYVSMGTPLSLRNSKKS